MSSISSDKNNLYPSLSTDSLNTEEKKGFTLNLDPRTQEIILNFLKQGEKLRHAKYLAYTPALPSVLKSRVWQWTGDTCRLIGSLIMIKSKVDQVLASDRSTESKIKDLSEIAQLVLKIIDTQYSAHLPHAIRNKMICLHQVCELINSGASLKTQIDGVLKQEDGFLEKRKSELDVMMAAFDTLYKLDACYKEIDAMINPKSFTIFNMFKTDLFDNKKIALNLGWSMAKGVKTALNVISPTVSPAA